MVEITSSRQVFQTPWFTIVAKETPKLDQQDPFYSLEIADYVSVLAVTGDQRILLVRQYRPAVEKYTLELPSGYVDHGEQPEIAARRELIEETGYYAEKMEKLGTCMPDSGRLGNRIWYYFASQVTKPSDARIIEDGIELVCCTPASMLEYIRSQEFDSALHLTPFYLASLQNKLQLPA